MSNELNEMEALAMAALYIPELARGVEGEVTIEENGWNNGDYPRALTELYQAQRTLIEAGWRRNKYLEKLAPYDRHNIDVAVYWRLFDSGQRWIVVTAAARFGLSATFTGTKDKPW